MYTVSIERGDTEVSVSRTQLAAALADAILALRPSVPSDEQMLLLADLTDYLEEEGF